MISGCQDLYLELDHFAYIAGQVETTPRRPNCRGYGKVSEYLVSNIEAKTLSHRSDGIRLPEILRIGTQWMNSTSTVTAEVHRTGTQI